MNRIQKMIVVFTILLWNGVSAESSHKELTDNIAKKKGVVDLEKFLSIWQDISSKSDTNFRVWKKSLESIDTPEILNPEVLTTLDLYDNQKKIIKEFIHKTNEFHKYLDNMMVELEKRLPEVDNRSRVIKEEIEEVKVELLMMNGLLDAHLKKASIMIELLNILKSDHGKWEYQKYRHNIIFSSEELTKEFDRLSKAFINQYKKILSLNGGSKELDVLEKLQNVTKPSKTLWEKGRSLEFVAALCYGIAKAESDQSSIDKVPYPKYTYKEVKRSYQLLLFNLLDDEEKYKELFKNDLLASVWLVKAKDIDVSAIKDPVEAKRLSEGLTESIKQEQMQTESYIYLNHCASYLMNQYTPQQLWDKSTKIKDIYSVIKKEIEKDM